MIEQKCMNCNETSCLRNPHTYQCMLESVRYELELRGVWKNLTTRELFESYSPYTHIGRMLSFSEESVIVMSGGELNDMMLKIKKDFWNMPAEAWFISVINTVDLYTYGWIGKEN